MGVGSVLTKLALHSRAEAAAYAARTGGQLLRRWHRKADSRSRIHLAGVFWYPRAELAGRPRRKRSTTSRNRPIRLDFLHAAGCPNLATLLQLLGEATDLPVTPRLVGAEAEAARRGLVLQPHLWRGAAGGVVASPGTGLMSASPA